MRKIRPLLWIFALPITYVALALIANAIMQRQLVSKVVAVDQKLLSHSKEILADLRLLDSQPPFAKITYTRNAEAFLRKHVSFSSVDEAPLNTSAHVALRALMGDHKGWRRDKTIWKRLISDPRLAQIDTSWMDELSSYDHWDWTQDERIQSALAQAPRKNGIARVGLFANLPLPDFLELNHWAIVHVIKSSAKGDVSRNLENFRATTHLMHSAATLISSSVAASMLYDEQALAIHLDVSSWKPVSAEVALAYRRLSWAWVGIARLPQFNSIPEEFLPYIKSETGVCSAAFDSALGLDAYQDLLEPKFPLELDFSANFQRTRDFQKQLFQLCHREQFAIFQAKVPSEANSLLGVGSSRYWNPSRIPFIRRYIALLLMSIAVPDFTRLYEERGLASTQPANAQ